MSLLIFLGICDANQSNPAFDSTAHRRNVPLISMGEGGGVGIT